MIIGLVAVIIGPLRVLFDGAVGPEIIVRKDVAVRRDGPRAPAGRVCRLLDGARRRDRARLNIIQ